MVSKKASASNRAANFLASFGTAGGAIGAPDLVMFGAADTADQTQYGNIDQYAAMRSNLAPAIGDPDAVAPVMSRDLDSSYLKLNLPGSPLPANGLFVPQNQIAARNAQNLAFSNSQYAIMPGMPFTPPLPFGLQPTMPTQKGKR